jgi:hypothetical protein
MATLLCWCHLFLLPALVAVRGQPQAKIASGLLKAGILGAIFCCVAVALGMFIAVLLVLASGSLVAAFIPLLPGPSLLLRALSAADIVTCLAMGAVASGVFAGLVAMDELPANAPRMWRIALGAAMASIVMMPWPPINLFDGFSLLFLAALPSLILFRPTGPAVSTPMSPLPHDVIAS